jgi:hypothetical protein
METKSSALFSLNIDPITKTHLAETAKWARFLAVLGMIVLILALLATLMSTTILTTLGFAVGNRTLSNENMTNATRISMVVGVLVTTAVAFFPLLFLFRFATAMRSAITANDQNKLNTSFQHLKIYFRYLGIVAVLLVIFYGLIVAIALIQASSH